jgi:hypothetical protein
MHMLRDSEEYTEEKEYYFAYEAFDYFRAI